MTNDDYRAMVGPAKLYDEIGALQFFLLFALGLRSWHKLLDIGCGVLRLGRLAIAYLESGNYYGLEPDREKLIAGFTNELGYWHDPGHHMKPLEHTHRPHFDENRQFNLSVFDHEFDYLIAHSIFTHTPQAQIRVCFASVAQVIKPAGCFVFTYFQGGTNYAGDEWAAKARYKAALFRGIAESNGLRCKEIFWHHPKGQRWLMCWPAGSKPPTLAFDGRRKA